MNATAARPVETNALPLARALPAWVYNHPEMTPARVRADSAAELADGLPRQRAEEARATT